MKRLIILLYLLLIRNGYKRAAFLKKRNYFFNQGQNCFFATHLFGTEPNHISFGNNVWLATRVNFITHDVSVLMIQSLLNKRGVFLDSVGYIKIGDNVFIGANTTILPNVEICDNVIIGAGSLVSKSINESGVYVGNPLKKVNTFDNYLEKIVANNSNFPWTDYLVDRKRNRKILIDKRRKFIREKFLNG